MSRLTFVIVLLGITVLGSAAPVAARSAIALGIASPKGVVDEYQPRYGRKPALWALWSNWGGDGDDRRCDPGEDCAFPFAEAKALLDRNITPYLWWQPVNPDNPWGSGRYSRYSNILNGTHDAYIRQWARDAKRAAVQSTGGKRIIVRLAHESAGPWFPWGFRNWDNTATNFKKAWRRVVNIFNQVGARRYVKFLWSQYKPNETSYPGDRHVDYVGFTVLNFGEVEGRNWRTMPTQVRARVKMASFTRTPIILAEVASSHIGGNKAAWLKNGYLDAYKISRIKAIVYLDTNQPRLTVNHPDWRLCKPGDCDDAALGSAELMYRWLTNNYRFKGRIR